MPTLKPNSFPWICVVALALMISGYMGAYYAMVTALRVPHFVLESSGDILEAREVGHFVRPKYDFRSYRDFGGHTFFAPAHWLDRRIRPNVWEPSP